jgi:hypothetical protein
MLLDWRIIREDALSLKNLEREMHHGIEHM